MKTKLQDYINEAYNNDDSYTKLLRSILGIKYDDMSLETTYLNNYRNDSRISMLFDKSNVKLYNFFCELWNKIPTSLNSYRYVILPKINKLGYAYGKEFKRLAYIKDTGLLTFIRNNYEKIFDVDTCYELMNQMYITNVDSHISELSVIKFLNEKGYKTESPTLKDDVKGIDIWVVSNGKRIPIQVKCSKHIIEENGNLYVSGALDLFKISNIRYMFVDANNIYSIKDGFTNNKIAGKWKIMPKTTYNKIDWKTNFANFNRQEDAIQHAKDLDTYVDSKELGLL